MNTQSKFKEEFSELKTSSKKALDFYNKHKNIDL